MRNKNRVPEGQMGLFHKMGQPVLNTPEAVRDYLKARIGSDVGTEILTQAAKSHIRKEMEHETDPIRLARLKELLS